MLETKANLFIHLTIFITRIGVVVGLAISAQFAYAQNVAQNYPNKPIKAIVPALPLTKI